MRHIDVLEKIENIVCNFYNDDFSVIEEEIVKAFEGDKYTAQYAVKVGMHMFNEIQIEMNDFLEESVVYGVY